MTGRSCHHAKGKSLLQTAVLFTAVVVAVLSSEAADWHPIALVLVLSALAVASDVMIVEVRGLRVSGAFFSVVLAMVLLGPALPLRSAWAPRWRTRRSPGARSRMF